MCPQDGERLTASIEGVRMSRNWLRGQILTHYTVEAQYNEVLGTRKFYLFYQVHVFCYNTPVVILISLGGVKIVILGILLYSGTSL